MSPPEITRRSLVEGIVGGAVGFTILPNAAFADVTNKVASSGALRNVKRSQSQLRDLVPATQENDFVAVKGFLRTPPFADVRKSCFTVVRGGEDGPKSQDLQKTYKAFIASIEKIDSTASLGIRGRKIPPLQLTEEYAVVESTIQAFIAVAEEANEIPVQYD